MSPTIGELRALLALCCAGKLYDVERWISAGKPIIIDPSLRKTALLTAMETGFHSLVELLVRHEQRQEQKDRALADAVERRRLDMVEVLVEYGARIESVPLHDVLLTWERPIMRFFLDHGADAVTGKPFAIAFQAALRHKDELPDYRLLGDLIVDKRGCSRESRNNHIECSILNSVMGLRVQP